MEHATDLGVIENQRRSARKTCYLKIDGLGEDFAEVHNISTDGMLIASHEKLEPGKPLQVRLFLPAHPKPLRIQATVLRNGGPTAAVGFTKVGAKDRGLIKNFIANETSYDTLKKFQKRVSALQYENLKPFTDPRRVLDVLRTAEGSKGAVAFTAIMLDGRERPGCYLDAVDAVDGALVFSTMAEMPRLEPFDAIFFVFKVNGVPYYLEAAVRAADDFTLRTTIPEFMYYAEKRIQNRQMNEASADLALELPAGAAGPESPALTLHVLEMDSFGMSVRAGMEENVLLPETVVKGIRLSGVDAARRTIPGTARVAHVTPMSDPAGNFVRVGLQYLVERRPYVEGKAHFPKPAAGLRGALEKVGIVLDSYLRKGLERVRPEASQPFEVVRAYNRRQEEIVGLVNATFPLDRPPAEPVPVVLIAPAHGKRKETTSAFALTLQHNFRKHGKQAAVVRYDQIRSVGESYKDPDCRAEGREVVRTTMSQNAEDCVTMLRWLREEAPFKAGKVAVVSFSMGGVAVRKALQRVPASWADYWVAAMGLVDMQEPIVNHTGGLDYIVDHLAGKKFGVVPIFGHMVDMDHWCRDAMAERVAFLEHVREDLANIEQPVTWIYGKYDYWVNQMKVRDVMSVAAKAEREVIEVPTGHIVKTSDEAFNTFLLVTRKIWGRLYGEDVEPVRPPMAEVMRVGNLEWARTRTSSIETRTYWKRYLMGEGNGDLGFDVIYLADEYQQLLADQATLLQAEPGERIVDVGAGTGNLEVKLLTELDGAGRGFPELILVDLIPEALERARGKIEALWGEAGPPPGLTLRLQDADLTREKPLPFEDGSVDKCASSLVINYLPKPLEALREMARVLRPGGLAVVSSFKPDVDMSKGLVAIIEKIERQGTHELFGRITKEEMIAAVRYYINAAATLLDLEEQGVFRFYDKAQLAALMKEAGFREVRVFDSMGEPSLASIAVGVK